MLQKRTTLLKKQRILKQPDITTEKGFNSFYDSKHLDLKKRIKKEKESETNKDKWSKAVSDASDVLSFVEGIPESVSHVLNIADVLLDPSLENILDNTVEYGIDAIPNPLIDATLGSFWYGHKWHLLLRDKGAGWVKPAAAPSINPSDNTRVVNNITYFKK